MKSPSKIYSQATYWIWIFFFSLQHSSLLFLYKSIDFTDGGNEQQNFHRITCNQCRCNQEIELLIVIIFISDFIPLLSLIKKVPLEKTNSKVKLSYYICASHAKNGIFHTLSDYLASRIMEKNLLCIFYICTNTFVPN